MPLANTHISPRVFRQLLEAGAVDVVQIDSYRLTGVSETLAVLMAPKFLVSARQWCAIVSMLFTRGGGKERG
jgi:L-alanine-DL-glutamate epimerase-like enolase superfamily enzyme